MTAGTKIVQLRDCLRALLPFARHLPQCPGDVGGVCRCGFTAARSSANHLVGADAARTGRPT
jgi:hypothetical protein